MYGCFIAKIRAIIRGCIMKKVVSFSGGRTSAYLCKVMIDTYGRDNVDFIYMDTGAEHPKTYEFIKNVDREFGLNLTCLRGDFNQPLGKGHTYKVVSVDEIGHDLEPYYELMKKYGTPSVISPWCTSRMKEETHDKYCNDKYGKESYQTWIGIRVDEPKRLRGIGKTDRLRYMAEISEYEKEDVLSFWKGQPFDLGIEEHLGNCVFCFKKSNLKLAAAQRDEPELYRRWLEIIDYAKDRPEQERESKRIMYRGRKSLESLIATFDGSTGEEIKSRIRGSKMIDTNSCSESCEVFQ